MPRLEVKFAGFGGQGIVTLAKVLASTASIAGKETVATIAYGGQSRGGSSFADVIVDDEEIDYPRVPKADILVLFSQEASTTFGKAIRDNGLVLYDPTTVQQLSTAMTARIVAVPATNIARDELKVALVANVVMFGVLVGLTRVFSEPVCEAGIAANVPREASAVNIRAFHRGLELAGELARGKASG